MNTSRILSAGLAAALLLVVVSVEQVCAQSSRRRAVPSQRVQDQDGRGEFFESSSIDSPTIEKKGGLFTLRFKTGIVFRARCYYVIYDPCPDFSYLLRSLDVVASLAQESRNLMNEMLDEKGIVEELEELITERIREDVKKQRGVGPSPSPSSSPPPTPPLPTPAPCNCPSPPPPPDGRRLLLGTAMLAGGGVLGTSKNEWVIDEGYVGVGIGVVGLVFVFKELVPEWRGLRIESSGANMSVSW